jgi:tetratricopeptide (TPR) repeat protein
MATHPEDHSRPHPEDKTKPAPPPATHDEQAKEPAAKEAQAGPPDKPVDESHEEIPVLEAMPEGEPVAEAQPVDVTGADLPVAEASGSSDTSGAEHVLHEELPEAQPISSAPSGDLAAWEIAEVAEPAAGGVEGAEAVLGDEPLDRGSRPSARAESPIRAQPDDEAIDYAAEIEEAPPLGSGRDFVHLEATEFDMPSGELKKDADLEKTVAFTPAEEQAAGGSGVNLEETKGEGSGVDLEEPASEGSGIDLEATAMPGSGVDLQEGSGNLQGSSGNLKESSGIGSGVNLEEKPGKGSGVDLGEGPDESSAVDLGKETEGSSVDLGQDSSKSSPSGIDRVAEALESGVSLEEDAPITPPKGPPSVEFDDILAEEAAPAPPAKKGPTSAEAPEGAAALESTRKKKKKSAAELEEEAAAAMFDEGEESAARHAAGEAGVPVDEEEAAAIPVADDEAVAAPVEDEDAGVGLQARETDELPSTKPRTSEKAAPPAPPAPAGAGCLGRVVGAALFLVVGIVLAVGGVAAMAFVAPGLIEDLPFSPWTVKKTAPAPVIKTAQLTGAQKAFEALAAADYDRAMDEVKDDNDDAAKAARGEARVLKVLKGRDLVKQPLGKAEKDEVDRGLQELRDGKNEALANLVGAALRAPDPNTEMKGKLQEYEKSLVEAKAKLDKSEAGRKEVEGRIAKATSDLKKLAKDLEAKDTALAKTNKTLKQAEAAKEVVQKQLNEVDKALAGGNVKESGVKGIKELLDTRASLQKDRDELDAATKAAFGELVKAKVVPPDGDPRKQLAEGVRLARRGAESPLAMPLSHVGTSLAELGAGVGRLAQKGVDMSLLAAELGLLKAREQFIETPDQKLGTYAALLQNRNRKDPKELAGVLRETDWLLSNEAKATPEVRGKALYVSGLALRNQGKFEEARKALRASVKLAGDVKGAAWTKQARQTLTELTDPSGYYLPQIEKLRGNGNLKGAINETNLALKAMPGNGRLLAERGILRLEQERGKGKISAAAQKQIRADAALAAKAPAGAAQGAFVLGLLEEELGQFAKAEEHFRQAIKAHTGKDEDLSRYRIALVRVLLRDRPAATGPAVNPMPPAEKKKDKAETPPTPATPGEPPAVVHPIAVLLLSVTIGAQPPDDLKERENPEVAKRVREGIELAKTLASSKDARTREQGYALLAQAASKAGANLTSATCLELGKDLLSRDDVKIKGTGHLLVAQALAKQGKRTDALKEYTRGLGLLYPGLESKEVVRMIEEHPAFQHPDAANRPNPILAEKHFGLGLHLYWTNRYPEAETEFKQAIDLFSQDARYFYYLGLSQLGQKSKLKRDQGYYSFEKGAQLEAINRPSIVEINTSLERVQGDDRRLLNTYRNRSATLTP